MSYKMLILTEEMFHEKYTYNFLIFLVRKGVGVVGKRCCL